VLVNEKNMNEKNLINNTTNIFEKALLEQKEERYVLRLYVAGSTPRSLRAIANLKIICEENLKERYDLEVIDVYQHQALFSGDQIIAMPTLIKKKPLPVRKIIGDLSNSDQVKLGLDLKPEKPCRNNADDQPE
jgi:circadian clock protein KaiB